ncbi:MAG: hypothetical protein F6K00_31465 [Leptolyngbya sp. SIOISBB]|nr:hypothetical protein [Leptolyngbya sp. SIOISBB]
MLDKPILQMNPVPTGIDVEKYANARSSSNPNGSLTTLYAFRNLVDSIPNFTSSYIPSGKSLEDIYGLIVSSATSRTDDSFVVNTISEAQRDLSENTFSDMDGTLGVWRPVYAVPENWFSPRQNDFQKISWKELTEQFAMIGQSNTADMQWRIGDSAPQPLNANSRIESIQFEYLIVNLTRPWLSEALFRTNGWFIPGQAEGFCSSGQLDRNDGILPLLLTGLLVGRKVKINGIFNQDEQSILTMASEGSNHVSLGPFVLDSENEDTTTPHILGWISSLVPFSPRIDDSTDILQWNGKTEEQLIDSLSSLPVIVVTSIILIIENYTNLELLNVRIFQETGTFKDPPPSRCIRRSRQGFTTHFDLTGGPEGWAIYSFNSRFNIMFYWKNFLTERNAGYASFIPRDEELTLENIRKYNQEDNRIGEQGGFLCSAIIGSGFQRALFRYSISTR